MRTDLLTTIICLSMLSATNLCRGETKIKWQGYTWQVKSGAAMGPGPNQWDSRNVWVDSRGFLHLKISKQNGHWSCAELGTDGPLGFGTYQCQVEGAIDRLDPNVVFSMFSYEGPDGVKEIDIEYARWGNPMWDNGSYTVYPNDLRGKKETRGFPFKLDGTYTTSRYSWSKDGVHYWMLGGHQPVGSVHNLIQEWDYRPKNPAHEIPLTGMRLRFNLWLFQGHAPSNDQPVEVVIHSFSRTL